MENRGATRVLVIDDDRTITRILRSMLEVEGYQVEEANQPEGILERIAQAPPDLILLDLHMPRVSGIDLLRGLRERGSRIPVLVLTGESENVELAVETLKQGAMEYLVKPVAMDRLHGAVRTALKLGALREERDRARARIDELEDEVGRLRRAAASRDDPGRLVGTSSAIQAVHQAIERAAGLSLPVLIQGEEGTGRELVARLIHERSARASGPLVKVRCRGVGEALLEAELGGGRIEAARGGTLYIDEVGDLGASAQASLLRLIDRTGEPAPARDDVRLIVSTERDLGQLVRAGSFREDLGRRLAATALRLPALRERREDIPLLAAHFLARQARARGHKLEGFEDAALARLLDHPWPGNVRELELVVARACLAARDERIGLGDLPPGLLGARAARRQRAPELGERERLVEAIEAAGGNKSEAARRLGIGRTTLWRKLREERS